MPRFPKRQANILAFVQAMIDGYQAHAGDFPSSIIFALLASRGGYITARDAQIEAMAAAQVATDEKDTALAALVEKMKDELKKSEVDVGGDSAKLEYIGWGPKASASPADPPSPPGQPRNLDAVVQGAGSVLLDWKAPAGGSGGTVRTYVIHRRAQPEGGGQFGDWAQVAFALESEAMLMNQPRGPQLEYRVRAINTGGESPPSNTVAVVL